MLTPSPRTATSPNFGIGLESPVPPAQDVDLEFRQSNFVQGVASGLYKGHEDLKSMVVVEILF